jgi:type IV secretory pathway TrbL component
MHRKAVLCALCLLCLMMGGPTYAQGFLGDVTRGFSPDIGKELNKSNEEIGKAVEAPYGARQVPNAITAQSRTCVTTVGSCQLTLPALTGTACFCGSGGSGQGAKFGRIQ